MLAPGLQFISKYSSLDIDAEKLAGELGIQEFKLSAEHDESVFSALSETYNLVQDWPDYPQGSLGPILREHQDKIFQIFDACPVAWRLPLYISSDMYCRVVSVSDQGEKIFRNIINCWKWYAYIKSHQRDLSFYEGKEHGVYGAHERAQAEIDRMIQGAWGRRHQSWFTLIGAGDIMEAYEERMRKAVDAFYAHARFVPNRIAFQMAIRQLFKNPDLPFERMFIDSEESDDNPGIDIPPLNFLLCQNHLSCYAEILRNTTLIAGEGLSDHLPAWSEWIKKYFDLIMQSDSEVKKAFYYAFSLTGNLFENGKISKRFKRRSVKSTEGLPEEIYRVLEEQYQEYRRKRRERSKLDQPGQTVARLPIPPANSIAMASLVVRPVLPTKELVPTPKIDRLFADHEAAKKSKKQLTKVDFSSCHFPEGTQILLERSLPGKKPNFQVIELPNLSGTNEILPVLGKSIEGHFHYRITINLPQTHRFEGRNVFEVSFYAKADPTPEELAAGQTHKKDIPVPVAPVVEAVERKVEIILDPVGTSLIAAAFVLEANQEKYSTDNAYESGPVEITISNEDATEILGAEAGSLLPQHRRWIVCEDGNINPATEDADIREYLFVIADKLRTKAQIKLQEQQEQAEYLHFSQELRPCLDLLQELTGTEGLTESTFRGSLNKAFTERGVPLWADIDRFESKIKGSRNAFMLQFRGCDVVATYMPTGGLTFSGAGYEGASPGKVRAYDDFREVLEALGDFLFLSKARKVIRLRKMKAHREKIVAAFVKNLKRGRGEMIVLRDSQVVPSFLGNRRAHALFPSESCPLPRYISPITLANLREQYDDIRRELGEKNKDLSVVCLVRKGYIQMGGDTAIQDELSEDKLEEEFAEEEQLKETTVERNINSLFRSPQGRDLLWDRIYATKGDGTGTAIYNGSLQVLNDVLEKKYGDVLPVGESEKQKFIDDYLEALREAKILLSYVRFTAITMSEVEKILAKTTAD